MVREEEICGKRTSYSNLPSTIKELAEVINYLQTKDSKEAAKVKQSQDNRNAFEEKYIKKK